jgi:preprotein translocase subunit SecD
MVKRDKWRLGLILAVILIAAYIAFPIQGKVRLGLDLRGGVHIVLQAKGTPENPVTPDSIDRLLAVLRSRIDQYGIAEPVIQKQGDDRIAVDLPGVEDPEAALDLIGRTAVLEFRQVLGESPRVPAEPVRSNYDSDEQFRAAQDRWQQARDEVDGYVKQMEEAVKANPDIAVGKGEDGTAYLLGKAYVTGKDLTKADTTFDQFGKAAVSLKFNSEGAKLFDEATAANVGKQIAIVLDGVVISAPVVQQRISGGEAQITGKFSTPEANRLAIMLRAGALPVAVEILENRSVGPSLGADSINDGIKSGLIGAVLVVVFMLIYYGFLGLAADLALCVAMLLVMASLIFLRSTLTLLQHLSSDLFILSLETYQDLIFVISLDYRLPLPNRAEAGTYFGNFRRRREFDLQNKASGKVYTEIKPLKSYQTNGKGHKNEADQNGVHPVFHEWQIKFRSIKSNH